MNTFQSTLSSSRNQRILFWVGLLALAAGIVVLVLKFTGGSDHAAVAPQQGFKPVLPAKQTPLKDADGANITSYKQLDPTVKDTIRRFVLGAVAEQNYADSWNVLATNFKRGYTAKTWTTSGSHPLIPFPVYQYDTSTFTMRAATTKEILVGIKVKAKPGSGQHETQFMIGLIPAKSGKWLVNYWGPLYGAPLPYGGDG
jgi:hypothetical protein